MEIRRLTLIVALGCSFLVPRSVLAQAKPTPAKPTATKPSSATKPSATTVASKNAASTTAATGKPTAATTSKTTPAKGVQGPVGPIAPLPKIYAPTRPREIAPKYAWKLKIPTTIFWIGESPTENNPTPNHKSSWDTEWQINYGGYDDPNPANRHWDFRPKSFVPNLNPFYVALPFNDVTNREIAKIKIPWHKATWNGNPSHSVCRGRWLAIRYGNKTCYAQWEDCGPWETDDHEYVFGKSPPKNLENDGAGLDVSPAVRDYLGLVSGGLCDWRFVEESEVPDGPWCRFGKNNPFVKDEAKELERIRAEYAELVRKRDEWLKNEYQPKGVIIRP